MILDERICPVCKKHYMYNAHSIYEVKYRGKVRKVCSYTCWNVLNRLKDNKEYGKIDRICEE